MNRPKVLATTAVELLDEKKLTDGAAQGTKVLHPSRDNNEGACRSSGEGGEEPAE